MSDAPAPAELAASAGLAERSPGDNMRQIALATALRAAVDDWTQEQLKLFVKNLDPGAKAFVYHHFVCYPRLRDALCIDTSAEELASLVEDRLWRWERAIAAAEESASRFRPKTIATQR
jgi:hypothetical protein